MNDIERGLIQSIVNDVHPLGISLEPGLFSLESQTWIAGSPESIAGDFGEEGYVLTLPGRQQWIGSSSGGGIDGAAVVEAIRDWVIDEVGHGWPELYKDGRFVALLSPVDTDTGVMWRNGDFDTPVGTLSRATIALPPQWGAGA